MIEILKFIFSSFWIWAGAFLMLAVIFGGIGQIGNKYNNNQE